MASAIKNAMTNAAGAVAKKVIEYLPESVYISMGKQYINIICDTLYYDEKNNDEERYPKTTMLKIVEDHLIKVLKDNEDNMKRAINEVMLEETRKYIQPFLMNDYISLYMMQDILENHVDFVVELIQKAKSSIDKKNTTRQQKVNAMIELIIHPYVEIKDDESGKKEEEGEEGEEKGKGEGEEEEEGDDKSGNESGKDDGSGFINPAIDILNGITVEPPETADPKKTGGADDADAPAADDADAPADDDADAPAADDADAPAADGDGADAADGDGAPADGADAANGGVPVVPPGVPPGIPPGVPPAGVGAFGALSSFSGSETKNCEPPFKELAGESVEIFKKKMDQHVHTEDIVDVIKSALLFHLSKPEGRQMCLRQIEPVLRTYVLEYTSKGTSIAMVFSHLCSIQQIKAILETEMNNIVSDDEPDDETSDNEKSDATPPTISVKELCDKLKISITNAIGGMNQISTIYKDMMDYFTSSEVREKIKKDTTKTVCTNGQLIADAVIIGPPVNMNDQPDGATNNTAPPAEKNTAAAEITNANNLSTLGANDLSALGENDLSALGANDETKADENDEPKDEANTAKNDTAAKDDESKDETKPAPTSGGKLKRVSKTKRRRRTFRKRNTTQRHL